MAESCTGDGLGRDLSEVARATELQLGLQCWLAPL